MRYGNKIKNWNEKNKFWKNEKDTDKQKFEHWDPAKNFEDLHMVSDVVRL